MLITLVVSLVVMFGIYHVTGSIPASLLSWAVVGFLVATATERGI